MEKDEKARPFLKGYLRITSILLAKWFPFEAFQEYDGTIQYQLLYGSQMKEVNRVHGK